MTAAPEAVEIARIAALAAADKIAHDIAVIDVSEQLVITDVFVIASADNERQVNAIVDEIEDKLREAGHKPARREGAREGRWALLDYTDIVVHILHTDEREFYALEKLWKDCPTIEVDGLDDAASKAAAENTAAAESTAELESEADQL